jgi:hypothetical protein
VSFAFHAVSRMVVLLVLELAVFFGAAFAAAAAAAFDRQLDSALAPGHNAHACSTMKLIVCLALFAALVILRKNIDFRRTTCSLSVPGNADLAGPSSARFARGGSYCRCLAVRCARWRVCVLFSRRVRKRPADCCRRLDACWI